MRPRPRPSPNPNLDSMDELRADMRRLLMLQQVTLTLTLTLTLIQTLTLTLTALRRHGPGRPDAAGHPRRAAAAAPTDDAAAARDGRAPQDERQLPDGAGQAGGRAGSRDDTHEKPCEEGRR